MDSAQSFSKVKNVKAILEFCNTFVNSPYKWKLVNWTNETKITPFQSNWHRPHEQLQRHQVKKTAKHGG